MANKRHRSMHLTGKGQCTSLCNASCTSCFIDRISSLQDELLSQVLSFLPTKDAVATSTLSKRWRHIFTWITSLQFDYQPISHRICCPHSKQKFTTFRSFVDNVLMTLSHQSRELTKFAIRIRKGTNNYCHCATTSCHQCDISCFPDDLKPTHVYEWVSFPLAHRVRELDLCINVKEPAGTLPHAVFCSDTLEILKLDTNLGLEAPIFNLPNMRVLHMYSVEIPDGDFLTRLVSSCLVLEELSLKSCPCDLEELNISSPSLRKLVLVIHPTSKQRYNPNSNGMRMVYEEEFIRDKVLLNTPNLQYLEYVDNIALCYDIRILPLLAEASIRTSQTIGEVEIMLKSLLSLLRPLSTVQHLRLGGFSIEVLEDGDSNTMTLPVFDNLIHLELHYTGSNVWSNVVLDLLNHSPNLERLTFPDGISLDFGPGRDEELEEMTRESECRHWSCTTDVPLCLSSHLKRLVISRFWGLERELELVKYFLRNALVLEELVLVCEIKRDGMSSGAARRGSSGAMTRSKMLSIETLLQNLPRGSVNCSINVQPVEYNSEWKLVPCKTQH